MSWFQVLLTGWAGDPPAEAVEASGKIVACLGALVGAKRRSPVGDLVSVLVATGDDALTTQELLSSLFQLVVAGHDTTASLIGNGWWRCSITQPSCGRCWPTSGRIRPWSICHVSGWNRGSARSVNRPPTTAR